MKKNLFATPFLQISRAGLQTEGGKAYTAARKPRHFCQEMTTHGDTARSLAVARQKSENAKSGALAQNLRLHHAAPE